MRAAMDVEEGPRASVGTPALPRSPPVVIVVAGMAGTGKTTLVHRMQHYAQSQGIASYYINLDPAVAHVPYNVNIDIRDTVNYKEVMRSYRLGPNGAIMTSLNLFATKFHQVVSLLEAKEHLDWIVVDTPGQIEVFTWSASGQLISESLAAAFPTLLLFVADTTRCVVPQTFMSTMLYSSGITLKQQLPLLLVFNKIDVASADVVVSWMRDPGALEDALSSDTATAATTATAMENTLGHHHYGQGSGSSLARSMALFLHEFYEDLPYACVSAASGTGLVDLTAAIAAAKEQALRNRTHTCNTPHVASIA